VFLLTLTEWTCTYYYSLSYAYGAAGSPREAVAAEARAVMVLAEAAMAEPKC